MDESDYRELAGLVAGGLLGFHLGGPWSLIGALTGLTVAIGYGVWKSTAEKNRGA